MPKWSRIDFLTDFLSHFLQKTYFLISMTPMNDGFTKNKYILHAYSPYSVPLYVVNLPAQILILHVLDK